jgi:hypothetical protein
MKKNQKWPGCYVRATFGLFKVLKAGSGYSIIHLHTIPKRSTSIDKRHVIGVYLIHIVGCFVDKDKRDRKIIGMINDRATGIRRSTDVAGMDLAIYSLRDRE